MVPLGAVAKAMVARTSSLVVTLVAMSCGGTTPDASVVPADFAGIAWSKSLRAASRMCTKASRSCPAPSSGWVPGQARRLVVCDKGVLVEAGRFSMGPQAQTVALDVQ